MSTGFLLDGRYQLGSELGATGAGAYWRAVDRAASREVAVKLMHATPHDPATYRRAMLAAPWAAHPGLVGALDAGVAPGPEGSTAYVVVPLPAGPTLAQALRNGGALATERAVELFGQVVAAVGVLHDHGQVHGDLATTGLAFDAEGWLSLLPSGLVRGQGRGRPPGRADAGAAYRAPETARGGEPTPAADVYALGCVLFEMLTGHPPYLGNEASVARQHAGAPVPRLGQAVQAPALMETTVTAMLAKDPAHRPDLRAVAESLTTVRRLHRERDAGGGRAAAPAALPAPARDRRRVPLLAGAAAALLVAIGVGGAVALHERSSSSWGWTYDARTSRPAAQKTYPGGLAFDCGSVFDWVAQNGSGDLKRLGLQDSGPAAGAGDPQVCYRLLGAVLASN